MEGGGTDNVLRKIIDFFGSLVFLFSASMVGFYLGMFGLVDTGKSDPAGLMKQHLAGIVAVGLLVTAIDLAFAVCLIVMSIRFLRTKPVSKVPHILGLTFGVLGLFPRASEISGLYWFCSYRWRSADGLTKVRPVRNLLIGLCWVACLSIIGAGTMWWLTVGCG